MTVPAFVFRCDGSPKLGMGHVRRCLSLAAALRSRGGTVCFVMSDVSAPLITTVRDGGFEIVPLVKSELAPAPGASEAGSPEWPNQLSLEDAHTTLAAAHKVGARVVLVDHYGASAEYLETVRRADLKVAVIDDLAERTEATAAGGFSTALPPTLWSSAPWRSRVSN